MPTWDENHHFLGWFDAEGNRVRGGDPVTGGTEKTVYAHWAEYQTVYFDPNGGTHDKASVRCVMTYSGFTMPSWDGHDFLGWWDAREGGTRLMNGMAVTGGTEKTVYAHWRELVISSMSMKSVGLVARDSKSVAEQAVELSFETVAGTAYEVQWAASLDGEWTVLKSWVAEADGETSVTVTVPADSANGFFRLAVP
jgi:ribosomal protein L27